MALNKISLAMLEKKVVMDVAITAGGALKLIWSDETYTTYTPPAMPTVDLSGYYTRIDADSRFLTKAQADGLYDPLGAGGVTPPPISGGVETWNLKTGGLTWSVNPSLGGFWSGNLYNNWGNGIYRIDGNMISSTGSILSAAESTLIVFVGAGGTSTTYGGLMPDSYSILPSDNQAIRVLNVAFYFTSGAIQINGVSSNNALRIYKLS